MNDALPLRKWISRGMTGIFHSQHFAKVIDKVVAGSVKVLVFVSLALVEHSRHKISTSENAYEAVARIKEAAAATEEAEMRIISVGLERWARDQQKASSNSLPQPQYGQSKSAAPAGDPAHTSAAINASSFQAVPGNYSQPNFPLSLKIVVEDDDSEF